MGVLDYVKLTNDQPMAQPAQSGAFLGATSETAEQLALPAEIIDTRRPPGPRHR